MTVQQYQDSLADPKRPWRTDTPLRRRYYERFQIYGNGAMVVEEFWTGTEWRRHAWSRAAVCLNQNAPWRICT